MKFLDPTTTGVRPPVDTAPAVRMPPSTTATTAAGASARVSDAPPRSRRSIQANPPSVSSASAAAGTAPARIVVESTIASPRKMYSPRPPAPTAAAMVAVPTPMTAATRIPATICGSASGSSTMVSSCRRVIPIATPASMIARSIVASPVTVVRTIGRSA